MGFPALNLHFSYLFTGLPGFPRHSSRPVSRCPRHDSAQARPRQAATTNLGEGQVMPMMIMMFFGIFHYGKHHDVEYLLVC